MGLLNKLLGFEEKEKEIQEVDENQYFPPGWINNGLDFSSTIREADKLKNKKKANLNATELVIANNAAFLRSCYGTPEILLELGNYFIGKYNFDPYFNPYSNLKNEKYSENLVTLNGSNRSQNGFLIENWNGTSLLVNPPFSNLSDGAKLCNQYSQFEHKPGIAFICNLDYSNYFQECCSCADYMIILGRVQFKPMPGLKNSSPTGSSAMFIYNSKIPDIETGFILLNGKSYYLVNLKNKKEMVLKSKLEGLLGI